jgi:DNA ligase 1
MDYAEVLRIINEIDSAKGNAKHPLIIKYLESNKLFNIVVKYCYDSSKTYKITKIEPSQNPSELYLFFFLDRMNNLRASNNALKLELGRIASVSPEKFIVVSKILDRNLGCGITAKTLNKLVPGLVPYFPYMRCSGLDQIGKIQFPCISQLKADGEYFDVFCSEYDPPVFRTRNGKIADFSLMDTSFLPEIEVKLCGEALVRKDDGADYELRKDGNAIINKALYGELSQEEADRIEFIFWDAISDERAEYVERWEDLDDMGLNRIECEIVNSMEEAWKHYDFMRSRGLEGTILKNFTGLWNDGNSHDQIKLKAEKECELLVTDTTPGEGKYKGMIGALVCTSSCGRLITDVGMGLSDEDRVGDWIGKLITVRFNEVSKSKNKNTWALTHARLIEEREDKNEADDLDYIRKVKEVKR